MFRKRITIILGKATRTTKGASGLGFEMKNTFGVTGLSDD